MGVAENIDVVQTYPLESGLASWHDPGRMYLRPHSRGKDGKVHAYWSLVETVRTPDGPQQDGAATGEDSGPAFAGAARKSSRHGRVPRLRLVGHTETSAEVPACSCAQAISKWSR